MLLAGLLLLAAQTADDHVARANEKLKARDIDGALVELDAALKLDPAHFPAMCRRIELRATRDRSAALADAEALVRLHPRQADAYAVRARVRGFGGDSSDENWEARKADYTRACELDPKNPVRWADRASFYDSSGLYPESIADLTRAIELRPDAEHFWHRGMNRHFAGDLEGELSDYVEAVRLDPAREFYRRLLAEARRRAGDIDAAFDELARIDLSAGREAEAADALHERGLARLAAGRFKEALEDLDRALAAEERGGLGGFLTLYDRGRVKAASGDLEGARRDFERVVRLEAEAGRGWTALGCLRYDAGDWPEARKALLEAEDAMGYDECLRRLWLVCLRLGADPANEGALDLFRKDAEEPSDEWPRLLSRFVAGKLPERELLRAAEQGSRLRLRDRLCEAYYYAGSLRAIRGGPEAADLLRRAVAQNHLGCLEHLGAVAELKRLGAPVAAFEADRRFEDLPAEGEVVDLAFAPDGGRAWVRWKAGGRERVIGMPGDYERIGAWAFDRHRARVAFVAGPYEKQVVVDPRGTHGPYPLVLGLALSADGERTIYGAVEDGTFLLRDGGRVVKDVVPWSIHVGPDGRYVYVRREGKTERLVTEDGREGPVFTRIRDVVFSRDGRRIAYAANEGGRDGAFGLEGGRWRIVVDGRAEGDYDSVWDPVFSRDGARVAFCALKGKAAFVVDGKPGPEFEGVRSPVFGAVALAYVAQKDERTFVVVGDKPGEPYDTAGGLVVSPNGRRFAHAATLDGRAFVVVDGVRSEPFDRVDAPVFSPEGRKAAFGAQRGRALLWKVTALRE